MKSSFISTLSIPNAIRGSIGKAQIDLARAQKEATTGRHADTGLALGRGISMLLTLKAKVAESGTAIDMNGLVSTRLKLAQETLASLGGSANGFIADLVNARISPLARELTQNSAAAALESFLNQVNQEHNGQHLFSGIATDRRTMTDYYAAPASAARTAVVDAFTTAFGFPPGDPAVSGVSAAAMETFLGGDFAALFDDASWQALWSNANDANVESRIAPDLTVTSSANANDPAFRKLTMAYVMVAELSSAALGQTAFDALAGRAAGLAAEAAAGFGGVQSALGSAQGRTARATERLERQRNLLEEEIAGREGVDQFAAAAEVNQLITQLEASYQLTARIGALSLLNYL
jgi:flagellar hook-associated protein 3 FlgL